MTEDGRLLRDYARNGSEEAFAEVVRRHLDLVYSTALRAVNGDQHLAQDICQSVFIDLGRKAPHLARRQVLGGWLYTSTCFAAAKAVRSERRRQAREVAAYAMNEPAADNQEMDWEHLRPILDSAMLELKEADREAVLLRFFERRSLAEVGSRLGLSENAARMRIDRALDRLRERLGRRGVSSTAAALVLVLTHEAIAAAPAGLTTSITANSLAACAVDGGSGGSLLNFIFMSNVKCLLTGAAITAVTASLIMQHRANGRLKAEMEALRQEMAMAGSPQNMAAPDPD